MTSHAQIRRNVATALQASTDIQAYCIEKFGKGALVIVNWFGAESLPGEEEAPFIFVFSEDGDNDSGFVDEQTFRVSIVCGGVDDGDEPTRSTTVERTTTANGLVVNGIDAELETLRGKIETVLASASLGATIRTFTRTESSTQNYPLEWAKLTVEFFEPETL